MIKLLKPVRIMKLILLMLLSIASNSAAIAMEPLKEGQIWKTPVNKPDMVISLIQRIEHRDNVRIIHISSFFLSSDTWDMFVLLPHIPIMETTFRNSTTQLFMSSEPDPKIYEKNFNAWKQFHNEPLDISLTDTVILMSKIADNLDVPIGDLCFASTAKKRAKESFVIGVCD